MWNESDPKPRLSFTTPQWTSGPRVRIDSLDVGAHFEDTTGARAVVTGRSRNGEMVTTSNSAFGYACSAEVLVVSEPAKP